MGKDGFQGLKVWKESKDLAVEIYRMTEKYKFKKDLSLSDQMRRSAVSVPSNIAEGDERNSDKDAVRFFYIAKGSLAELRTQLMISADIGYIESDILNDLESKCKKIGAMLGSLIKVRSNKNE